MGASLVEARPEIESKTVEVPARKIGTDWDGVGVKRHRLAIWTSNFKELGIFNKGAKSHSVLESIPDMDHTPVDVSPKGFHRLTDRLNIYFQKRRKSIPGAAERFKEEFGKGVPVIIISGRRATLGWDRATRAQADRVGIPHNDVVLKPVTRDRTHKRKISGIDSKIHAIIENEVTEFYEDNRKTAIRVARQLPNVQVNYIDYGAHIKEAELSALTNLNVIPKAEWHKTAAQKLQNGVSETRNSTLREGVATPIQAITRLVHRVFPWLTPTHLNFLGAAEVVLGAVIAAIRDPRKLGGEKGKTAAAATLITKGSVMDAFDGALARLMAAEDPNSVDFKKGSIFDTISDRVQEVALAFSRAWSAAKRGGKLGWVSSVAALATAVTSFGPSLSRALSEFFGKPVPESGKGISGLIGTRPGRAFLGTLATLYPEPKGIPLQLGADLLMTTSNVITTTDRLRTAFGSSEATLSQTVRDEAKTRLKVLGGLGAFALASSVLTYWILSKRRNQEQPEARREIDLMNVISGLERYCKEQGLEHRFVGGTFTDFIGPQTKFAIDISKKTVTLVNPNKPALIRSDETVKDIDMVVYTPDQSKLQEARRNFAEWGARAEAQGLAFPQISLEAARHPDWPKRNPLKQFVTAWEVDEQNVPHLTFGAVDKAIKPSSIEPWKADLGNGTQITILNPVAHALCYALRVPSGIKRKDKAEIGVHDDWVVSLPFSKISLVRGLARQTIAEGLQEEVDYNVIFREWADYIEALAKKPDFLTKLKGIVTGLYWNTIGTEVAHGKGIFRVLSKTSDKLTGQ